MSEAIWKFKWDVGRMGIVEGIFLATDADVAAAIGKEIYFGEILGKHSEIEGDLDDGDIVKVTDDPVAVDVFRKYDLASGYNPLDYLGEDEGEEE